MARKKLKGLPEFTFGQDEDLDKIPSGRGVRSNPVVEGICQVILQELESNPIEAGKGRPLHLGALHGTHTSAKNLLLRIRRRMVKYIKAKRTPVEVAMRDVRSSDPVLYFIGKK